MTNQATLSNQLLTQYRDSQKPIKDDSPAAQIAALKKQIKGLKARIAEITAERDVLAEFIDEHTAAAQDAGEDY